MNFKRYIPIAVAVASFWIFIGCGHHNRVESVTPQIQFQTVFDVNTLPAFTGSPFTVVNNNIPFIRVADAAQGNFENYSELDKLGRCGVAYVNACKELMPTEKRGKIGNVKPTGWHTVRYNGVVDGNYLYNRCHLVAYSLAGENANERNLITGTRYLNNTAMLPFENMVVQYIKKTGNHVLYRVTPVFIGDELVARGVFMEAYSVEDNGAGICFNVFCHNVQPGIDIDYKTGDSKLQ